MTAAREPRERTEGVLRGVAVRPRPRRTAARRSRRAAGPAAETALERAGDGTVLTVAPDGLAGRRAPEDLARRSRWRTLVSSVESGSSTSPRPGADSRACPAGASAGEGGRCGLSCAKRPADATWLTAAVSRSVGGWRSCRPSFAVAFEHRLPHRAQAAGLRVGSAPGRTGPGEPDADRGPRTASRPRRRLDRSGAADAGRHLEAGDARPRDPPTPMLTSPSASVRVRRASVRRAPSTKAMRRGRSAAAGRCATNAAPSSTSLDSTA